MNRSGYRNTLPKRIASANQTVRFSAGRQKGQRGPAICRFCYRRDRIRFDLGLLTGYGAGNAGAISYHLAHIGRDLADDEQIKAGTYAENLRAEFNRSLEELNSIIADAKAARDTRTVFDAMKVKNDTLKSMARAFGLAPGPGRPSKGRDKTPEEAGQAARSDIDRVVDSYRATNAGETGDEVAGVSVEAEGGEPG